MRRDGEGEMSRERWSGRNRERWSGRMRVRCSRGLG